MHAIYFFTPPVPFFYPLKKELCARAQKATQQIESQSRIWKHGNSPEILMTHNNTTSLHRFFSLKWFSAVRNNLNLSCAEHTKHTDLTASMLDKSAAAATVVQIIGLHVFWEVNKSAILKYTRFLTWYMGKSLYISFVKLFDMMSWSNSLAFRMKLYIAGNCIFQKSFNHYITMH